VKEERGCGEAKREVLDDDQDHDGDLAQRSQLVKSCHNRCPRVTGHSSHGFDWGQKEQKAEGKGEGN